MECRANHNEAGNDVCSGQAKYKFTRTCCGSTVRVCNATKVWASRIIDRSNRYYSGNSEVHIACPNCTASPCLWWSLYPLN